MSSKHSCFSQNHSCESERSRDHLGIWLQSHLSVMDPIKYSSFEKKLTASVELLSLALENQRKRIVAADRPHQYRDKFHLANFITNSAMQGLVQAFSMIGLDQGKLRMLRELTHKTNRNTSLRFHAKEACILKQKSIRDVESDTKSVRPTASTYFQVEYDFYFF